MFLVFIYFDKVEGNRQNLNNIPKGCNAETEAASKNNLLAAEVASLLNVCVFILCICWFFPKGMT